MLLVALPVTCYLVGGLLILVTLVAVGLFLLKSREVASLKKEVEDLRDTMRMMRYEEASLSRMLHTVDKSPASGPMRMFAADEPQEEPQDEPIIPVQEDEEQEAQVDEPYAMEEVAEPIAEKPTIEDNQEYVEESAEESADELVEESVEEPIADEQPEVLVVEELQEANEEQKPVAEEQGQDETDEAPEAELEIVTSTSIEAVETLATEEEPEKTEPQGVEQAEPIVEKTEVVEDAADEVEVELPKVETASRKQAINERRPAIPHDLFSAWFAENEDVKSEEVVEEDVAPIQFAATTLVSDASEAPDNTAREPQVSQDDQNKDAQIEEAAESPSEVQTDEVILEATSEELIEASQAEEEIATVKMNKEDERFCRKLERIVNTRMRNPDLNIDVIASQFGMGRTNFYRKVRELMGMSPNDYLRKCRMERAAALIKDTNMPIAEICAQVGVPDAQYFSRVFKTFYGVPPSTYREQL